jgi:hypothetical protein
MLGDAAEYKLSNERQKVLALMRTAGSLTPKVAGELLERPAGAIRKLLWTMARDGELHADGKDRYSLIQNSGHSLITDDIYYRPGCSDGEIDRISAEARL